MHKWYDGKAPNCDRCGWLFRNDFPDGEHEVCRWFSSVFREQSTAEPCDCFMTPANVAAYLKNNEKTRARGVKQGKDLNLTMKHGRG